MGWAMLLGLALAACGAMIWLGRIPRATWEMVGAALVLGIAGYIWQGQPHLPGSPRQANAQAAPFDEDFARLRQAMGARWGKSAQWLTMSDGMARSGDTESAANILISGLHSAPGDADLWVGMGNALVAHAGGVLTPAAEYSFRKAMRFAPESNAAPFFLGLALARNGKLDAAEQIWTLVYQRTPEASPLHRMLARDLAEINRVRAAAQAMPRNGATP